MLKKSLLLLSIFLFVLPSYAVSLPCYKCKDASFVAFKGEDAFDKRKKAKTQFRCTIVAVVKSCDNPKGTVGIKKSYGEKYAKN